MLLDVILLEFADDPNKISDSITEEHTDGKYPTALPRVRNVDVFGGVVTKDPYPYAMREREFESNYRFANYR